MKKKSKEFKEIEIKSTHWDWWGNLDIYWQKVFCIIIGKKYKNKWRNLFFEIIGKEIKNINHIKISLNELSKIINLKKLKLDFYFATSKFPFNARNLKNIEPLSILTNLEDLYICGSIINNNLSPLIELKKIKKIDVSYNQIENIEPLRYLIKLEYLNLDNNKIQNLEPLKNLINLKYLSINQNKVGCLEPLKNLINIERLELSDNKIESLISLRNLIKISFLSFNNT